MTRPKHVRRINLRMQMIFNKFAMKSLLLYAKPPPDIKYNGRLVTLKEDAYATITS